MLLRYQIVRNEEAWQKHQQLLASNPAFRDLYGKVGVLGADYARLEFDVSKALQGAADQGYLAATWTNPTGGLPEYLETGLRFVVVLRKVTAIQGSQEPSATIKVPSDPELMTVLQAPCSQPFLFESTTFRADEIRRRMARPQIIIENGRF